MSYSIVDLPEEMREKIYNYCWVWELTNVACVSKSYHNSVLHLLWHSVRIPWAHVENKKQLEDKKLEYLKYTSTLGFYSSNRAHGPVLNDDENDDEGNDIVDENCEEHILEAYQLILNNCHPDKLESMYFNWPAKYINLIKISCELFAKSLREITFRYLQSVNIIWKNIGHLKFLRKLSIEDCTFKADDMKPFPNTHTLRELNLIWNSGIPGEGLSYISNLSELRKIALNGNELDMMDTNAFKKLKNLQNLTDLSLEFSSINDNILTFLCSYLIHLEKLSIAGCKKITDPTIQDVCNNAPKIRLLNINHTNITDNALVDIQNLQKLKKLYMRNTTITNLGISYLQSLDNLIWLDLSYTLVSDNVVVYLQTMTSLKTLGVSGTGVTVNGIARLKDVPAFTHLIVSGPASTI